jgi:hypothetical protein
MISLGLLPLIIATDINALPQRGTARRISIENRNGSSYKRFLKNKEAVRSALPTLKQSKTNIVTPVVRPSQNVRLLNKINIHEFSRQLRRREFNYDQKAVEQMNESANVIYVKPYVSDSRSFLHVFDKKHSFFLDYAEIGKTSLSPAYLDFIKRASTIKVFAEDRPWINLNTIGTLTSSEAIASHRKGIDEFGKELEKHTLMIQAEGVALLESKTIEGLIVAGMSYGKQTIIKNITKDGNSALFSEAEFRNIDPEQSIKEILVKEGELLSRDEVQRLLKDKTVVFTKDLKQGIENLTKLNKIEISTEDIQVLNFLPKDEAQAQKIGLHWSSKDVELIKESIWPALSENIPETQILTREMNKKENILHRYYRRFFERKGDGKVKDGILTAWQNNTARSKADIIIFVAHGWEDYLRLPTGEGISRSDIGYMAGRPFENKVIFLIACNSGLESRGGTAGKVAESFTDVFKQKGAISVVAPDFRIDFRMVPSMLQNIFTPLRKHKTIRMKELIREFQKPDRKHEDEKYPSWRVEVEIKNSHGKSTSTLSSG